MTTKNLCKRRTVHHVSASVQGLAFVGSEVVTFNAVTNSFLQSEWLAALLQVTHLITC